MLKVILILTLLLGSTAFARDEKHRATSNQAPAEAIQSNELKVGVKGMVCAFCAQGIEKRFMAQKEVDKVDVSLANKYVKIKFKDGQRLSNEKIAELLKEAGYEASFGEK